MASPAALNAKGQPARSSLPPSEALHLCLRAVADEREHAAARAALADPSLAWDAFIDLARFHGVVGLVRTAIDSLGWGVVPPAVHGVLTRRLRLEALRAFVFAQELVGAAKLLAGEGIRVLAWKGPALAAALYGSFGFRSSADLDLLVDDAEVRRAAELLTGENLCDQGGAPRGEGRHVPIFRPGLGICFELQSGLAVRWGLTADAKSPPLDFAGLWNRRETVTLCGQGVACPGPVDLAVLLSVHGARHGWNRWIWLCDIDRLLRSGRLGNGRAAAELAAAVGAQRRLHVAVGLARDLLGSPIPATLRQQVDHPLIALLSDYAAGQISDERGLSPHPVGLREEAERDLRALAFSIGILDRLPTRLAVAYSFLRDRCRPDSPPPARSASLPARLRRILHLRRWYGFSAAGFFLRSVLASLTGIPTSLAKSLGIHRS